jgi:stage V sporulation protein G
MNITDVRIRRLFPEGKVRAIASITIDDCFAVHDIRVIEGKEKTFVAMPSRRLKDGTFPSHNPNIAHPINAETRAVIENAIMEKYNEAIANVGRTEK